MRARGLVLTLVVSLSLALVAIATPARAAPVCKDRDDCKQQCQDGHGAIAACTRYGDLLAQGKGGGAPERGAAVEVYRLACDPARGPGADDGAAQDPAACLALAGLFDEGWLFEVDADKARQEAALRHGLALARAQCEGTTPHGCGVAAQLTAAMIDEGLLDNDSIADALALAKQGCKVGDFDSCALLRRQAYAWVDRLPGSARNLPPLPPPAPPAPTSPTSPTTSTTSTPAGTTTPATPAGTAT
ncbi:MAG TPA: hypothetical protein VHE35_36445, partial [Kofleriaceae bacterium]|nr:hypothetical protein [Kofleriaceae bacterium]